MSFDFKKDPFENFLELYKQAQIRGIPDANAMALATANSENQPSVRIVFFKGIIDGGFSFYTNYEGRKGQDIAKNPKVSVNFFWPQLDQQVRVEGVAEKLSATQSQAYFATRPRLSQLGAWASQQSREIPSVDFFQEQLNMMEEKYRGRAVPCPPHWGGYRIVPNEMEFWFGRMGRLHERYLYEREGSGWRRFMRSP